MLQGLNEVEAREQNQKNYRLKHKQTYDIINTYISLIGGIMGYQEAFRPINHLAEAVGIREAIEVYKDCREIPGYCTFYCATRSKEHFDENGNPELYACVGGDRCVSTHIGRFFMDPPPGWVYSDHFEDLDNALLDEAALERPDLVASARAETERCFEELVEETRRWEAELARQREELRPILARYLSENGPTRHQDMFKVQALSGYSELGNVLIELVAEGFLEEKRSGPSQRLPRYALAQKA